MLLRVEEDEGAFEMINLGMSFENYRAIDAINGSAIKRGTVSMRHMHHEMTLAESKSTASQEWGTLIHLRVLEPARFDSVVGVWDESRNTKAFKAVKDDKEYWLTSEKKDALDVIDDNIRNHPEASMILNDTEKEVVLTWDGKYGAAKARLDALSYTPFIADIKSTTIIEPARFQTHAFKMGMHLSAGWYVEGLEANGYDSAPFYLIVVESRAPYDVVVYEMDESLIAMGREEAVKLATLYKCCMGSYHGVVPHGITGLTMPEWSQEKPDLDFREE